MAVLGASLLLLAALAQRVTAQTPPDEPRSTMNGVYTTAQAGRGEETYMGLCVACHPVATYTGAAFNTSWGKRPLSDLFGFISEKMPKQDPGSLTPRESAQVIAYLLKMNGVPAGKTELPADDAALKKIRIEIPTLPPNKN